MRQRDGAVLALQLVSAGAADHGKRIAAPVEQNQRLLAAIERRLRLLHQRARKELLLPGLLELAAHVDEFHLGQRAVHHAVAHLDARVFALRGVLPAFQRRRRRAQHHHRAGQLGAHHGHVARVVARRLFLLVALVVLLVHENQAEIRHGRKDGRARADHDGRIAAPDAPPLLAALLRRERGVQQRDLVAEGGVEQAGRLRREADLRHQQNRRQSAIERPLHGGQIDGRLSRTGHAVQQKWMECPQRRGQRGQRIRLRLVQPNRAPTATSSPPRRKAAGRSSMRTRPRRTRVCSVDEGRSLRRSSASGSLAAAGRQLGQNGLLLFGQRGQARLRNQHGEALRAPRIALDGRGLARNPLLAHQRGQHRQRRRRRRAQRGHLHRLAAGQPLQNAVRQVLFLPLRQLSASRLPVSATGRRSVPAIAMSSPRPWLPASTSRPRSVMR